MKRLVISLGALWLAAGAALAGPLEDCAQARNSAARLKGCSDVIAGAFSTDDKARAYRNRAGLRLEAGAAADAVNDYTQALRLAPPDVAGLSGRARARIVMGDVAGAIQDYDEALKLTPDSATLLLARGHAHYVRGNAKAAIADFSEALRINPSSASAFNQRGLAFRRSGDTERAIADYTSAITINPVYALAYNNRGYAYEAIGKKAEAIADFRAALMLDASLVGARDGLARLGAPAATVAETEQRIREGRALVSNYCIGCHAVGPTGDSPNPKAPPFRTLSARHPGLSLREPLSRGIAAPHDLMPKFALTPDQVDTIIAYINSLTPGAAKQVQPPKGKLAPWRVATEAVETGSIADGRAYAQKTCAECHNVSGSDARSPNPKSPRFRDIANTPGMTFTALTVWSRSTHATMPNIIIPQSDLENLSAYILSLRAQRQ
ncbi:MAG: tetratricopeptide repeat protein [Hyphomicrobiales bacterium]|nr:MAG: tetratricopeptide repeat protein [Hyphomicrobiales bacterium]